MEKETNRQRISGRRSLKYKKIADTLEQERQQVEEIYRRKKEQERAEVLVREQEQAVQPERDVEPDKKEQPVINSQSQQKETDTAKNDAYKVKEEFGFGGLPETKEDLSANRRKGRRDVFIAVSIGLAVISSFLIWSIVLRKPQADPVTDEELIVTEPEKITMPPELKDEWLGNKAINPDFVGSIKFASGLIDLPFVQAKDVYDRNGKPYTFYTEDGVLVEDVEEYTGNDVYIWTNWKTGEYDRYDEGGSVFMDFRNNLKDQNLIIYGHHFARDWDPSGSKQFTPLDALLEEGNYEENKSFQLVLDNEIREYVITNVFTIQIDNDYELNIMRRNMNEDYSGNPDLGFFKGFIKYIDKANKYPISEQLNTEDNIVTLVTCMQHQPELRQIITAKEIKKIVYE